MVVHLHRRYEGLNFSNQKSRKLGVLAGRWREASNYSIVILINIRETQTIILK